MRRRKSESSSDTEPLLFLRLLVCVFVCLCICDILPVCRRSQPRSTTFGRYKQRAGSVCVFVRSIFRLDRNVHHAVGSRATITSGDVLFCGQSVQSQCGPSSGRRKSHCCHRHFISDCLRVSETIDVLLIEVLMNYYVPVVSHCPKNHFPHTSSL